LNRQLLDAIETELNAGKGCMLATILVRRGSAPRGVGTGMVVSSACEQTGTVGGGFLEHRVKQDALLLLAKKECAIRDYEIHADDHEAYSGGVTILFRPFTGAEGNSLALQIRRALELQTDAYLACRIENGCVTENRIVFSQKLAKVCGIDCPPEQPALTNGEPSWFIEPLRESLRVVLLGGGHVAQCMARQLALLDYRVWVVEDRAEFADSALFPSAERVLFSEYDCAEKQLNLTPRDHAIVMSRGHETDYQILRWLLRSEADYIGCIGSRRKISLTKERLLHDGLGEAQLARLHAPIGLAIGAQTPAEIAVSVAAEMIQYISRKASD